MRDRKNNFSTQLHAVRQTRRRPVLELQAVSRTHGELQIVDRTQQQRIETTLLRLVGSALATREVTEHRQLVVDDFSGLADRVFSTDRAVRLDIQNQLVEV